MSERRTRTSKREEGERSRALARTLMNLSPPQLNKVTLGDEIRARVVEARAITAQKARRREERSLAAFLREEDMDAVDAALAAQANSDRMAAASFQKIERWRDRLVGGTDDDVAALLELAGTAREDELRDAVQAAQRERNFGNPKGAGRRLFRLLGELL